MCGILAFYGTNTKANRAFIAKLLLQLSLRGTHATGLAWEDSHGVIRSQVEGLPANDFLAVHDLGTFFEGCALLRVIGHTRYATCASDDHQPLVRRNTALSMNGVISQGSPDTWPLAGILDYTTTNDAEVALLHAMGGMRGTFPGSFAIAELDLDRLLVYRNGERPLWRAQGEDFHVCSSTRDSLQRCGLKEPIMMISPGKVYEVVDGGVIVTNETFPLTKPDLYEPSNVFGLLKDQQP
jgi:glutamine phosphoribosylpyrophosphate amidotransferase